MADQGANINAAGCLGRVLSAIGVIWIIIVALAGLGVLSESGWTRGFFAGIGSSLIPGLLFLAAGRAVSRRARSMTETGVLPQTSTPPIVPAGEGYARQERPVQKAPIPFEPPPLPPPARTPPPPKPAVEKSPEPVGESRADVTRRLEETFAQLDQTGKAPQPGPSTDKPRPKTSQELVDEARRRWGSKKT
jgi:hypothetical protein